MDIPIGLWTTVYDVIDEDGQRILFKRYESSDEPKYMLEYPFDCFTIYVILEPMTDDMKNWRGKGTCHISEGCSDMFAWLTVESDKVFAINGIYGETGRYDSNDFETNLYTSAKTVCSKWSSKIKNWNLWYNKSVRKMSFNDMVKSQRNKNKGVCKSRNTYL